MLSVTMPLAVMLGFKRFRNAVITIAGIAPGFHLAWMLFGRLSN
jgi:hypothetical protein